MFILLKIRSTPIYSNMHARVLGIGAIGDGRKLCVRFGCLPVGSGAPPSTNGVRPSPFPGTEVSPGQGGAQCLDLSEIRN